jgi:hypothetical protein
MPLRFNLGINFDPMDAIFPALRMDHLLVSQRINWIEA